MENASERSRKCVVLFVVLLTLFVATECRRSSSGGSRSSGSGSRHSGGSHRGSSSSHNYGSTSHNYGSSSHNYGSNTHSGGGGGSRPIGFEHYNSDHGSRPNPSPSHNQQHNTGPITSSNYKPPSAPPPSTFHNPGSQSIPPIYRPPTAPHPSPIGFDHVNHPTNAKPLNNAPPPSGNQRPIGFEGFNKPQGSQGSNIPPVYHPPTQTMNQPHYQQPAYNPSYTHNAPTQGSYHPPNFHPNQGSYNQHPPQFTTGGRVPYHPQVSPSAFPGHQQPQTGYNQPHQPPPTYNHYVQAGPTYYINNAQPHTPNYHSYPLYQPTVLQQSSGGGFGSSLLTHGLSFGGGYLVGRLTGGSGGSGGSHDTVHNHYHNNYYGGSGGSGSDYNRGGGDFNRGGDYNSDGYRGGSDGGSGTVNNYVTNKYVVHHYYQNRNEVPSRLAVQESNLMPCATNTTENLCVPNTYAVCLRNGTIMCITNNNFTVPCENETCVVSVLPCVPENPACGPNQTITPMSIPCISNVSISNNMLQGPSNSTNGSDYCVTAIAEPERGLVKCATNATDTLCPGDTYAVCLGNGTVMCISHVNNIVQCGVPASHLECVPTKRRCVKSDSNCDPGRSEYTFELTQCLSKISVANQRILSEMDKYKYTTDTKTTDKTHLRVDYCVAKIVVPKSPAEAGFDWVKEGAKLMFSSFSNQNQEVPV